MQIISRSPIRRSLLTLLVVLVVFIGSVAAPASAAPTETADSEGEARTVIATPGQPSEREGGRTTEVTGEIILEEDRSAGPAGGVSGTITVTISLPEQALESNQKELCCRKIVREVGKKK